MKHTVVIKKKPIRSGKYSTPDGAICGNGDIGVILGDCDDGLLCHISKSDFWLANEMGGGYGGIKPVGALKFKIPPALYENYYVEQRMDEGEIFCRFADGNKYVELLLFVSHSSGTVFAEATYSDGLQIALPSFAPAELKYGTAEEKECGGVKYFTRKFIGDELHFNTMLTVGSKTLRFGNKIICAVSLGSGFDKDFDAKRLENLTVEAFEKEKEANRKWWSDFYKKSSFSTSDDFLEMNWYASQYLLAVCAFNKEFPPGLYGNFITCDDIGWKGDYHLNYNYQGSFYGACSSNHVELTDCYASPLLELRERGRSFSKDYLDENGVFYPVGIGPKGMITEQSDKGWELLFLGQRSNAVHSTDIMVMRWYATYDEEYARKTAYPFFLDVADFWEGYLVERNGIYNVVRDSIHEIPYYRDDFDPEEYKDKINEENNLLTLGLLKMFFKCLIDMSEALNIDIERRKKWQIIVDNLCDFSTFEKDGKTVFRYTSKGTDWDDSNTLCIQHIYPCGQIGLGSDSELLKIAHNTFFADDRWDDGNGGCSYFPCAARIGVEPKLIIRKMKQNFKKFQLDNMLLLHGGGCLENSSIACTTLNEMVMQSHEGTIRLFPVWDRDIDCSFKNLRADGAFLVSASLESGKIVEASIFSEKGRRLRLQNPFECAEVSCNGKPFCTDAKYIELDTDIGSTVCLKNHR